LHYFLASVGRKDSAKKCNQIRPALVLANVGGIMTTLLLTYLGPEVIGPMAGVAVPVVLFLTLFGIYMPIHAWTEGRRKEREAYYKAETMRRIMESSPEGAQIAADLIREEYAREAQQKMQEAKQARDGVKLGGFVVTAVGLALCVFLRPFLGNNSLWLVGFVPMAIGIALLLHSFFFASAAEEKKPGE